MATGDQADIVRRLKSILPFGWFFGTSPVLDGMLNGAAALGVGIYTLCRYVVQQARISTATDGWLDIISTDFFGTTMPRRNNETDTNYRIRILANILPIRASRAGIIGAIKALTGYAPIIVELFQPGDTGAWSRLGGWSIFGAWTSVPPRAYQAFVTIIRKPQGIPNRAGYKTGLGGWSRSGGPFIWGSLSDMPGYVPDKVVFDAINGVKVFGTIVWARFQMTVDPNTGPPAPPPLPPAPAYTGAWGPTINGSTKFALFGWSIPSAGAWKHP